ncbi:MAG: hypothetical protein IT176_03345 [Acidobacteria bacterium]|nr:hypothetical protein [Acidobacteriota bacterium]
MPRSHWPLAVLFAWSICLSAGATSVLPVSFADLVARADVIFVGDVVDVRPFPVQTSGGAVIRTRVVFRVTDPIFGAGSGYETFDFLGGEWGGLSLTVADMPAFAIGDRRIVFARRAPSINPIVGFTQGLLRIGRDAAGVDRVYTLDRVPLAGPEGIGRTRALPAPDVAMRLSDLRDRIARALVDARRR